MHWISTGFALVVVLIGVLAAWIAHVRAQECHHHAQRLSTMRSRIVTLEGALDSLHTQHRKLAGSFHATKARDDDERSSNTYAAAEAQGAVCDNYRLAQIEGPRSEAASCECDYCTRMRFERRQLRMELIPRTAAAQGALAKRNAGQE